MLIAIMCNCSGTEYQFRSLLQMAGVKDYMSLRAYKGADGLDLARERYPDIYDYIGNRGGYMVVVYDKNGHYAWADIHNNDMSQMAKAEVLVARYIADKT